MLLTAGWGYLNVASGTDVSVYVTLWSPSMCYAKYNSGSSDAQNTVNTDFNCLNKHKRKKVCHGSKSLKRIILENDKLVLPICKLVITIPRN